MVTKRTCEHAPGRLFPALTWDNGWSMSIQADFGYQCAPQEFRETLEEYETVEVKMDGPFEGPVDPEFMELPEDLKRKFTEVGGHSPAIGMNLTWDEVEVVKAAIMKAGLNPNTGISRGSVVWSGVDVFHGTSALFADDICENGVSMSQCSGGYFGYAFYVTNDKELAISNYAESAEDEPGLVRFCIEDSSKILDLRNPADYQQWQQSGLEPLMGRPDFPARARMAGIDGLYDNSVGGLAIYNPNILSSGYREQLEPTPQPGRSR